MRPIVCSKRCAALPCSMAEQHELTRLSPYQGFRAELEEIIGAAPRSRQTLLFSATVTESVASLSRLSMNKPVRVKIDEMGATARGLVQECKPFPPSSSLLIVD